MSRSASLDPIASIELTGVTQVNSMTPMKMTKTQVYFDPADLKALRRVAKGRGRSMADLIRDAVRSVWLQGVSHGPVDLWHGPAERRVGGARRRVRSAMIRVGEKVFVDTGAWVALALAQDPLNGRAKTAQRELQAAGARLVVSVPVVIETFTFLQRRYAEMLALTWRDRLREVERLEVIDCSPQDLEAAWAYLDRKDLHRLSLVDADQLSP